jgi:hypothetical protein
MAKLQRHPPGAVVPQRYGGEAQTPENQRATLPGRHSDPISVFCKALTFNVLSGFARHSDIVERLPGQTSRGEHALSLCDAPQQKREIMQEICSSSVILLLASTLVPAGAAEPDVRSMPDSAASPAAAIDDVVFLSGHWIGSGLGGCSEEFMAEPAGG